MLGGVHVRERVGHGLRGADGIVIGPEQARICVDENQGGDSLWIDRSRHHRRETPLGVAVDHGLL